MNERFPDPLTENDFFWSDKKPDEIIESAQKIGGRWSLMGAKTPSSQLRKYYGEVKRLQNLIEQEGWEKWQLEFKMLKAKAAYALRDRNRNSRSDLVKFIQWGVKKAEDKEGFDYFAKYFEAALGFAYGFGVNERDQ